MTGLLLALLTGTAWAQVSGLTNAEVIEQTSITDPGKAVAALADLLTR